MRKIKLWYIGKETAAARRYSKLPSSRHPQDGDYLWVPLSIIEHATKYPAKPGEEWPEHVLTLPEWFLGRESL